MNLRIVLRQFLMEFSTPASLNTAYLEDVCFLDFSRHQTDQKQFFICSCGTFRTFLFYIKRLRIIGTIVDTFAIADLHRNPTQNLYLLKNSIICCKFCKIHFCKSSHSSFVVLMGNMMIQTNKVVLTLRIHLLRFGVSESISLKMSSF